MISKASVLEAFETRFDFQSARAVLKQALAAAGMADLARFEPADIEALVTALSAMDLGRVDKLIAALTGPEAIPATTKTAAAQPVAVKAPAAEPAPIPAPEPDGAKAADPVDNSQESGTQEQPAAQPPAKMSASVVSQTKGDQKKKK